MPLNTVANFSIYTLSGTLAIFGGELFLAPQPLSHLFSVPLTKESNIYPRILSVRLVAIAALLWKARSEYSKSIVKGDGVLMDYARRDLRRVLFVSLITDVADIGCSLVGLSMGEMSPKVSGLLAGGSTFAAGLAALALRVL